MKSLTQFPSSKQNTQIPVWKHVFTTISRKQKDPNAIKTIMKKESSFEYQTAPSVAKEKSAQLVYGEPNDLKTPTNSASEQTSQDLPYIQSELDQDSQPAETV
ncbi:hypothetical protein K7432_012246 [Basidiobolus ranarum]|uniref:Uncharacterized protein n=1 Tax=Basidiobolus ranarum TaxID=34480 RepID=A0ABR2WL91_9FUNG